MRISDWSSDVCSSDLHVRAVLPRASVWRRSEQVHLRILRDRALPARRRTEDRMGLCRRDQGEVGPGAVAGLLEHGGGAARHALARVPRHAAESASGTQRSEEHTSELQSLMRISYAVFCLKKNKNT